MNIGSYINRTDLSKATTTTTKSHILRNRDRFRSSNNKYSNQTRLATQRDDGHSHFHLCEVGFAAKDVALTAAASLEVNPTCQAEDLLIARNRLAGSHKTVLRGNDAGISFAALDFRFIRNYDTEPWPVQRAR